MDTANRLKLYVQQIVHPGGRAPGTLGHELSRRYLVDFLKRTGMSGYWQGNFEQTYKVNDESFTNILGITPGHTAESPAVILAAHYDTCGPIPGADDNAAAVAILLDLAEELVRLSPAVPIVLAFFDAEEPPYYLTPSMGSVYFYHHQKVRPIHSVIVLDLCGHDVPLPSLEHALFLTGMESSCAWESIIKKCALQTDLGIIATLNRYIGDMSDHYIFRIQEIPYLFLSCGRWKYYHDPQDTPDKLNYEKMAAIRNFLLKIVCETISQAHIMFSKDFDPVDTELALLRRSAGHLLNALGLDPRDRRDLDSLVSLFIGQFGL